MADKKKNTPPWMNKKLYKDVWEAFASNMDFEELVQMCPFEWEDIVSYMPPAPPWVDSESPYGQWREDFIEWLKTMPSIREKAEDGKSEKKNKNKPFPFSPMMRKGSDKPFGITPEKITAIMKIVFDASNEDKDYEC